MTEPVDHVLENRGYWDARAGNWVADGERKWATNEPTWRIWGLPDTGIELLPTDLSGRDAIELGCGTGYVSAWMARRGARVVGVDNSAQQLATARRLAAEHGIALTLIHGNALELRNPEPDRPDAHGMTASWAHNFPAEQVWKLRKR